jgi:hypothetical protein
MSIGMWILGMGVIVLSVILHVYVRPYILRHRALKGPFMNQNDDVSKVETNRIERSGTRPSLEQAARISPMARPTDIEPSPAESSVNDVQDVRAQDNDLGVLSQQYEDMITPPWKLEKAHQGTPPPKTQLRFLSTVLSLQMNPISSVGSNRSVALYGSLWYLDVGSNKVWAVEKLCKQLHHELIRNYRGIAADNRKALLAAIEAMASTKGDPIFVDPTVPEFVACGQTKLYILEESKRVAIMNQLNESYFRIIQPALDAVCAEIVKRAEG